MEWIKISEQLPTKRDCDKDSKSGFSIPIIVSDGKEVWDDATACYNGSSYSDKIEITYWVHRFGYDYDSFELKGITHWMPLPLPPKT